MRRPALSVVVPCLDEEERLPRTLDRLEAEGEGCEVVVVDGGSGDGSREVAAGRAGVRLVRAPRSRGLQLNAGAAVARGETLFFLHADTLPPRGFVRRIEEALAGPGVVAGSFCLGFDAGGALLRLYSWCSRFNRPLFTYGDQGLFLLRAVFEEIGGFAPIPLLEDVEIQRRLRRRGRFVKVPVPVVTSARRFRATGALRQQAVNALLLLAYRAGRSPEALARLYAGRCGPAEAASAVLVGLERRLRPANRRAGLDGEGEGQKTGNRIGSSKRLRQDSGVRLRSSR